jgi:hypothetical protein
MGERIGNLNGIFTSIFIVILLGLAAILIIPTGPALASVTLTSPTPSAQSSPGRAAGPCGDKSKRYFDCGNGTVTDSMTGLIWLKQSNCLPAANWENARKAVAALKDGDCMLKDGSSPGDWRLPTDKEWEATMANAKDLKCAGPVLTNDAGAACIAAGPSSFPDVESDYYWSSTPLEGIPQASFGDLDHGNILKGNLINTLRVWPVRGGQR